MVRIPVTAAESDELVKTLSVRVQRQVPSVVPLSKATGAVVCRSKTLRESQLIGSHVLPVASDTPYAGSK
jgi:hypothetical protein